MVDERPEGLGKVVGVIGTNDVVTWENNKSGLAYVDFACGCWVWSRHSSIAGISSSINVEGWLEVLRTESQRLGNSRQVAGNDISAKKGWLDSDGRGYGDCARCSSYYRGEGQEDEEIPRIVHSCGFPWWIVSKIIGKLREKIFTGEREE